MTSFEAVTRWQRRWLRAGVLVAVAAVLATAGVTYELAADPDGELFTAFGGFGMPTTVLVDADGRVVAQHTGALTRADLEALVGQHFLGG
jgi:hypothetical protein